MTHKKWLMWGLLVPVYFFAFFHRTATSVIAPELGRMLGLTGAIAGLLSSTYFYVYGAMQLPTGFFADTVGPRRIAALGGLIMGVSTIVFACAHSLPLAMISRGLIGFGASFIFISLLRIQVNWFQASEFPLLTGLTVFGGNCGALFGVGPFAWVSKAASWQAAYIAAGAVSVVCAAAAFLFVRDFPPGKRPPSHESGRLPLRETLRQLLGNRNNYLTFCGFGLGYGGYMTVSSLWGVPYLVDTYGIDRMTASGWVSFLPLGMVIGSLLNGAIVKALGSARRSVIAMFVGGALLWAVVTFVRFPAAAVALIPWLLFGLGFLLAAFSIVYTTVRELNPERISGTALAFTNIGGFLTVALLQPLSGWMLDRSLATHPAPAGARYAYEGYRSIFALFLVLHLLALAANVMTGKIGGTVKAEDAGSPTKDGDQTLAES